MPCGPLGGFSSASKEEPWNTHSVLYTGHLLLIISTGQGDDCPHLQRRKPRRRPAHRVQLLSSR